ncbi:MAG: hypothetical protein ABI632_05010 [Pseudolysinimonas sp.]
MPSPTDSGSGGSGGTDGSGNSAGGDVDVSQVTGDPVSDGLIDPCSLLTVAEIEAATGVTVLQVVRGAVKNNGSQLCAYAMDAEGSTHAALAGSPLVPDDGGLLSVVNGLKGGGAAIGVLLSAQDPDTDYSGGDDSGAPSPQIDIQKLDLGKGGFAIATPNGGAAIAANPQNVLLTIMDLIAGPSSSASLSSMLTAAYGRLEG